MERRAAAVLTSLVSIGKTILSSCQYHQDGGDHLDATAEDDQSPEPTNAVQGEFETDTEQEQHNPELGEHLDLVVILNESQCVRPEHHSGDDEPRNGRHSQKRNYGDGRREDDDQVLKEDQLGHRRL